MVRFMSRWSIVIVAAACSVVRADATAVESKTVAKDVEGFRDFIERLAKQRGQRVADWWRVNVDKDPSLEFVALLCGDTSDIVIQKDAARRWDIRFAETGLSRPNCDVSDNKLDSVPVDRHLRSPKQWPANGVDFYEGHRGGYDSARVAIRGDKLVIIRAETLNDVRDGDTKEVKDWDRVVARNRTAQYPQIPVAGTDGNSNSGTPRLELPMNLTIVPLRACKKT